MPEILPDSRARPQAVPKGAVYDKLRGWLIPTWCASCAKVAGPLVTESMTYMSWICPNCEPKYGAQASLMCIPDEVVIREVKSAIQDKFGRMLTPEEIQHVVDTTTSPVTTLIKKGL